MKTAVVHDSLLEFGGAERILRTILSLYPGAHLYTAFADPEFRRTYIPFVPKERFHVSWLQRFAPGHHTSLVQAIAPFVWRSFDLSSYDLVISSSTHIMSCLVRVPNGTHIASLQYPPKNIFGIDPVTPLQRVFPYQWYIRPLFRRALKKSGHVIVNSRFTLERMKTYVGTDATVIYPPVDVPSKLPAKRQGKYYLCISRLVPYKNLELAIIAANKLRVPLKIFGVSYDPAYERHLKDLAGPTVEFLPFRTEFSGYFRDTIAFLFPTKEEDFGIAPLEASAHGVPVVAYYGGGARETVVEGVTGTFFRTHTADSLVRAIVRLASMRISPADMHAHAQKFSTKRYKKELKAYVDAAVQTDRSNRV